MKQCNTCKQYKSLAEFNNKTSAKDGKQYHCRICSRQYYKQYYNSNLEHEKDRVRSRKKRMRFWYKTLKETLSCEVCGENSPECMDFHHEEDKDFTIADAIHKGYSTERILDEISKCRVLCANCHRKLHARNLIR